MKTRTIESGKKNVKHNNQEYIQWRKWRVKKQAKYRVYYNKCTTNVYS